MGPFIGQRRDWKIVELSGLEGKLKVMNIRRRPTQAFYSYGDPANPLVYKIIGPYKHYLGQSKTLAQNWFNKIISKLRIEVDYGFAIHQNLWTWNSFHLSLKLSQGATVCYAISVLLTNIWTYLQDNQTSIQFDYILPEIENYLSFLDEEEKSSKEEENGLVIWYKLKNKQHTYTW